MITDVDQLDLESIDETPRHGYTSQEIRNLKDAIRRYHLKQQELSEVTKQWFLAILTGRGLAEYYLDRLNFFKSCSDELPEQLVQGKYKCRGNFIAGLSETLKRAISEELPFSDSASKQMKKLFGYGFSSHKRKRTTQKEIDFLNETIDIVIDDLRRIIEEQKDKGI